MAFEFELESESGRDYVESNGRFVKTYQSVYLVKSNSGTYNSLDEAKAGLGVLPGAPHPNWTDAKAMSIAPVRLATTPPWQKWLITIDYSTAAVVPESTSSTDPSDRRVRRKLSTTTQQRFVMKDRLGKMILDAAGSPFDGGVPVDVRLGTLVFEKDVLHADFDLSAPMALSGTLNSATWAGGAAGTVMLDLTADEKWEGGYHFWTLTYTFCYDKDGWQPHPANVGLYQLVGGARVRITEDGKPSLEPQPLYSVADGGGLIPVDSRAADANFISVDYYPTMDFNTLGLPLT